MDSIRSIWEEIGHSSSEIVLEMCPTTPLHSPSPLGGKNRKEVPSRFAEDSTGLGPDRRGQGFVR